MGKLYTRIILASLIFLNGVKTFAADFSVPNNDGFTLYYNYINDGKELELTYEIFDNSRNYERVKKLDGRTLTIPEEVTYMNRTRKVTQIGRAALAHSWIEKINLPKTIKIIDDFAFFECKLLQELILPDSVERIGKNVFDYNHKLEKIVIGKRLKTVNDAGEGASLKKVIVKDITSFLKIDYRSTNFFFKGYAYLYSDDNTMITNLIIPEGITKIGNSINHCKSIQSVTIPTSITEIDDYAFQECTNLTNVYMHDNITSIGQQSFERCSLYSLDLPKDLITIKSEAFHKTNLVEVVIHNKVESIGSSAFRYSKLTSVTIPESVKVIGSCAFDCERLLTIYTNISNPEEVPFGSHWVSGIQKGFNNACNKNSLMNATLFVPVGTMEKYKSADGWKDFIWIEEVVPSEIKKVEVDSSIGAKYFDLNGRQFLQPHKGVNIEVKSDGTTKKVFIK